MNTNNRLLKIAMVCLLCICHISLADEFHYNNILIGDRASGMGGAYTAISDDASGMFYNPAGIIYVTDRNFSASVNAYTAQTKTYDNVIGGQPFVRKSSALLANYFGIVKPIGNYKFGFSYAVPDSVGEDLNLTVHNTPSFPQDFTINLSNRDNTYNWGPSLAMAINSDLALGVTLYVHQREVLIIQNQFLARNDPTYQWSNSYFTLKESGLKPIVGIVWSPVEKLSLGATLSSTLLFSSSSSFQYTCVDTLDTANCSVISPIKNIPFQTLAFSSSETPRKYPIRVAVGAAYFANSNLLLSSDFTFHTAVADPVYGDKVATLDAAFGTEYYLSKKWAVRGGLFTNVANTPPIVAGVTNIEEHINLYGGSLSFTHFSGDSSVTIGGNISYGKGQAQIGTSINEVQSASTFGWTMFLSSSY